jgi:hypothetical protein
MKQKEAPMKRVIVAIGVIVLLTNATMAYAQQPTPPADPHHPPSQTQPPGPSVQPTPTPTPPAGGMMPMMEMCREMMAGHSMMGGGMMGGGRPMDPRMMAEMIEMRGEMMKAMGDIMLKHARRMQGESSTTK